MDVAETSLALAASFTTVPCALLLTDVALSMTLEASRVQHTGKALLETDPVGWKTDEVLPGKSRWWFQTLFIFTSIWGRFPS